eukprot:TRINITY_DN657_c0_g1_i1.p1 TRINITY_DN657_c0_g1~~TRINITY_DN657_c0_g1_i1.p1  ORF type:complete len:508 (-),score=104.77 TRINITY_DN657_c0_g1_i1:656-2179(-)
MNLGRTLRSLAPMLRLVRRSSAVPSRVVAVAAPALIRSSMFTASSTSRIFKSQQAAVFTRFYASGFPPHLEIGMPALSPTMTHGNISKWLKKEGDAVNPGDLICEVETDKATLAFECQEEGFLAKIVMPEGSQQVPVNKTVCILVENKNDVGKFASYEVGAAAAAAAASPAAAAAASSSTASTPAPAASSPAPAAPAAATTETGRIFASPIAKKIAAENNVDLKTVSATGPNNRIVLADVKGAIAAAATAVAAPVAASAPAPAVQSVAPSSTGSFEDIPHSNVRRVIASRLQQSKQTIPHFYLTIDCRVDKVSSLRSKLNEQGKGAYKLSLNDFVIKAAALALRKVPEANSSWGENAIRRYHNVDINVAVDTGSGLITPFVKDADIKGLETISGDVKSLAEKARANKLHPSEFQGGTFTISNLGMYGVKEFKAIINPPQACILAVGSVESRVVVSSQKDANGKALFEEAKVMSVTLSGDHRVVDGAVGAKWLAAFKRYIEDPLTMLL